MLAGVSSIHCDGNNSNWQTFLHSIYRASTRCFIAFRGNLLRIHVQIRQCQDNQAPLTDSSYRFTLWHLWRYKRIEIWRENWQINSNFFSLYLPWFFTCHGQKDNGRDEDCEGALSAELRWVGIVGRTFFAQRKNPGFTPITPEATNVHYNCRKLYVWFIIKRKRQLDWLADWLTN